MRIRSCRPKIPRHRAVGLSVIAACVAALVSCNEQPAGRAVAGTNGIGTGLALGRSAASAVPLVLPNVAADIDIDEARSANSGFAFSKEPIEPAPPVFHAELDGTSPKDSALQCLTAAVYYEAGGEPLQGERAVAQVVLNRVRHPSFPNSVCGVVYQGSERRTGCQFTFTCDGSLARRPAPDRWRRAEEVAQRALEGGVEPSVGMATHYHADWVFPYWAPTLRKIVKIGPHIFYTWPGGWGRRRAFSQQPVWRDTSVADQSVVELAGALILAVPQSGSALPPLSADRDPGKLTASPRLEQGHAPKLIADERQGSLVVDGQ